MTTDQPSAESGDQPLLAVINADATPEEIAALVAVFSALGAAGTDAARPQRPAWNHPARGVRRTLGAGVGGWRASGLPS